MEANQWLYFIHGFTCILSCVGGPFLCIRWLSVPLQLIGGVALQLYAIFLVWDVKQNDCYDTCKLS